MSDGSKKPVGLRISTLSWKRKVWHVCMVSNVSIPTYLVTNLFYKQITNHWSHCLMKLKLFQPKPRIVSNYGHCCCFLWIHHFDHQTFKCWCNELITFPWQTYNSCLSKASIDDWETAQFLLSKSLPGLKGSCSIQSIAVYHVGWGKASSDAR